MTETQRGMSMRAVTQLTGISEHLLRAWERRYGAVEPSRTAGGTRSYSDADVTRLRLLKQAVDAGSKIGEIASLSNDEILALSEDDAASTPAVDSLIELIEQGDPTAIDRELEKLYHWLGALRWAQEVASPLSAEIGRRWSEGALSIAQEHLATASLVRVVEAQVLELGAKGSGQGAVLVLTTPPEELHALGIELAALVAAAQGATVYQLGAQTPSAEVARYAVEMEADCVVVGVAYLPRTRVQAYCRALRRELPASVGLVVGGAACHGIKLPAKVDIVTDLKDFAAFVEALG